jgi:hypothetical protein
MAKPITVTVAGNAGPLRKSLQGADSDLAKFGKAVSDNAKKLALGFAAIGAGAVAGLGAAVKAAAEDQKAQALLADQLRKTTDATSAQILAMEQFVDVTQRATGIADDELRPALATLTRATGDLTQAQELLQLGLDISAGSGKSLEGISLALAKATNGNLGAFTKLGIPLDENIIKTKDFAAAQEVLAKQFGGASTVAANTFSGQMSRLRIVIGEAVESIGYAILENDYFQDSMAKFPNAVQAAIDAFGKKGIKGSLDAFVSNMGITGAYVKLFGLSVSASFADMANKATQSLSLIGLAANLVLGVINTVAGTELRVASPGETKKAADDARIAFELQQGIIRNLQTDFDIARQKEAALGAETNRLSDLARSLGVELETTAGAVNDFSGATGSKGLTDAEKRAAALRKELGEMLPKALEAAQSELDSAKKAFDDYAAGIADSLNKLDYGAAYDDAKEGGTKFLDELRKQATRGQVFAERIQQLVAAGLTGPALQQVIDAGAQTGTAIADELLKANENVLLANKLGQDLEAAAKAAGQAAAKQFKQEGVNAATELLAGVEETLKSYTIKLTSQKLNAKQLQRLKEQFYVDVAFNFQTSGYAIPALAEGGLVTRPTVALIGEAGPELVVPLDRAGSMGGGDTYQININAAVADARLGGVIVDALRSYNRRTGPIDISITN